MKSLLILFDIDGTLVDAHQHIVPASTIAALQQLKAKGYLLGISTGRSLFSVRAGGFDTLVEWDVYLCNNGQAIFDSAMQPIHMAYIPEESVRSCIDVAASLDSPLFIIAQDHELLTCEPDQYVIDSHAFFKEELAPVAHYQGEGVIMMMVYGSLEHDFKEYRAIEGITIIPGLSTYADVVLEGYHKHCGIEHVLKHFKQDTYIAFGDSLNDMEMIEQAAIGIAMQEAHEDLKAIADMVTDTVLNDGIMKALVQLHIL